MEVPSLALGMTAAWASHVLPSRRCKLRQNNLGRFREILRDPVGRTVGGVRFKAGPDANRFDSSVVPAMHVNFFVAQWNG